MPTATTTVSEAREGVLRRPLIPFERISMAETAARDYRAEAVDTVAGAWDWRGHGPVDLRPPVDWVGACSETRSWQVALQSWEPLAYVISTHDAAPDPALEDFAIAFAVDWAQACAAADTDVPFVWYDAAIGMRAYRLAYVLELALRREDVPDERLQGLVDALLLHRDALADDVGFAAHSNHGIYQVIGQLAITRRFAFLDGMEAARTQALDRLRTMVESHFTAEHVHREHSPVYHRLVAMMFANVLACGLAEEPWFVIGQRSVQDALAWFVLPDQTLAMLGDTERKTIASDNLTGLVSPALLALVTDGRVGTLPGEPVAVFPASGYASLRDRWPAHDLRSQAALIHACAFHSRVHKHADDQAVLWFDRGHELLVDAGRYGYHGRTERDSELFRRGFWYSDPWRVYVESTRAHNTVEIDGRSYDRTREPYGSGIRGGGALLGLRWSLGVVPQGDVEHQRLLLWQPGEWLLVLDALDDATGAPHAFAQRWNLAPELDLVAAAAGEEDDGTLCFRHPEIGLPLRATDLAGVTAIAPVRGQEEPERLGWISRQDRAVEPLWTFGLGVEGAPSARFATLLHFSEQPALEPAAVVAPGPFGPAADVAWTRGAERCRVTVAWAPDRAPIVSVARSRR